MKPDGRNLTVTVKAIYDEEGNSVESAPHPQQKLAVDLGADIEEDTISTEDPKHKIIYSESKSVLSLFRAFFSILDT